MFDQSVTAFGLGYFGTTPDLAGKGDFIWDGLQMATVAGQQEFIRTYKPRYKRKSKPS